MRLGKYFSNNIRKLLPFEERLKMRPGKELIGSNENSKMTFVHSFEQFGARKF